jgi:1-acyl-sn-glycerol-3-phosphate acyltransferase
MRLGYWLVKTLALVTFRLLYGLEVTGRENIPRSGKVVFASNHRSNFDPPILGAVIPREVHFFAKEELFRKRWLGGFIRYLNAFPVRRGQMDREALSGCLDVLKGDGALIFFPEGTRAPADGFLKAKLGVGWIIALSDAPVVPVYLHGTHRLRPSLSGRPRYSVVFGECVAADPLKSGAGRGRDLYQGISDRTLERIRETSLQTPRKRVSEKGPVYERDVIEEPRLR